MINVVSQTIHTIYKHKLLKFMSFALILLGFYIIITAQYKISIQFIIGYSAMFFMFLVLKIKNLNPYIEIFTKLLGVIIVLRYLYWRTFSSLSYEGFYDFIGSMLLYSAELFAIILYLLGIFTSMSLLKRKPVDLSKYEEDIYPTVDVLIPTYNESQKIIENTVLAALDLDYPQEKYGVYLLDDGGTDEKCRDEDPVQSEIAKQRRKDLQKFCREVGAHYLTREANNNAKAGNINAALAHVDRELILILDTDHVPAQEFLQKTVGLFLEDEKLFLVQTPHAFYNADPIERNLRTRGISIGENKMFYKYIQKGHDFWESSFFCGSAAVLKRKYIDEVGGIAGDTITEDAETALKLHDKGYKSAYIDEPMVRGLQPESFEALLIQRIRWTQGMIQLFLLKNPFLSKKLKWYQKLSYSSASFFWFFAYSRVIFFIAPLLYLFGGLKIYNANGAELLAYVVPHMFMAISMSYFLYAKVRSPFFSELYETILSFYTLPAIISTLRNPHDPTFKVTPKGEHISKDHVSHLGIVFVLVFIFIILGFAAAIYRLIYYPADYEVILATSLWNLLNLVLILAAIGVSSEKKDIRKNIRIPLDTETIIYTEEHAIVGKITDISEDGIRMLPAEKNLLDTDMHNDIKVSIEIHDINGELFQIPAKFLRSFGWGGHYIFIFEKEKLDIKLRQKLIHLVYGNTTNWKAYDQNKPLMNPHESFIFIIKQSVENVMFKEALMLTFTSLRKKIIPKGHQ